MIYHTRVSVLTSLYKHKPEYVRQCLESLISQTLKECEFILIDNGADEKNKMLIQEYLKKDSRFRAIYLNENIGMGAALNRGINVASGKYIGFLESDDFATPEMFADLYAKAEKENLDIAKSLFYTLNDKGNIKLENNFPSSQCEKVLFRGCCTGLIQGHVSHWSGIYKKTFLQNNKIFFNETPGGHSQDFGFILKCYAYAQRVYIIPHAYVTYRLYSGEHERSFLNECMLDECELTMKKLRKKKLPTEIWEFIFLRIAPRLKMCMQTANLKQQKRIIKEIKRNEKYQKYKYFSPEMKEEITSFIKYYNIKKTRKFLLWQKGKTKQKSYIKCLGIVIYSKKKSSDKIVCRYLYGLIKSVNKNGIYQLFILGLPIYFKQDKLFVVRKKMDNLSTMVDNLTVKANLLQKDVWELKDLCYRVPYFPSRVFDLHSKNLAPYKNIYKDRNIVICGSGPTLNYYKQISDAIHIGLNHSFEKENLSLDYIFAWDLPNLMKADKNFYNKIKNYPAKKILGRFLNDDISQVSDSIVTELEAITLFSSARHGLFLPIFDETIHYDIEKYPLMDFGSVAFGAFHFALYTGVKKIFLVGIDNKLTGYFSSDYKQNFLLTDSISQGWKKVKKFCEIYYPQVEIISINPIGLKGIFQDFYTEEYVKAIKINNQK